MNDLIICTAEQGTPEWHEDRRGVPSASRNKDVLAQGKGLSRRGYMYELAGEIITGLVDESWVGNKYTDRGNAHEDDGRSLYALMRDVEPVKVGFMKRGRIGASLDRLIGDDGALEIKTRMPKLQIELLESGKVPSEHVAQLQGQLLVSGRHWVDFASYCPGLPMFIERVYRDSFYLSKLQSELDLFIAELDALVAKYGSRS